ncbi:MAG: hypothetical protein WCO26_22030 [Deltaproteobacteria bacterium]
MMKQVSILTTHNCSVTAVAMLCMYLAFAGDAIQDSPNKSAKASVRITNFHLRADMLLILDSCAVASNEWKEVVDGLKPRFIQENTSLQPTEIMQTIKILEYYRKICEKKFSNSVRVECLLIALGESTAITNAVRNIAGGGVAFFNRSRSDLVRSEQPKVIIALGELLFRDDGVTPKLMGDEFLVYPLSIETAQIIIEILSSSEQFPPSVKDWARKETGGADLPKRRELVRRWWTQNKTALQEERFGDTHPPQSEK